MGTSPLETNPTLLFPGCVESSLFRHMMRKMLCALPHHTAFYNMFWGDVSTAHTHQLHAVTVPSLNIYPPLLMHSPAMCKGCIKMVSGLIWIVTHVQGFVKEGKADSSLYQEEKGKHSGKVSMLLTPFKVEKKKTLLQQSSDHLQISFHGCGHMFTTIFAAAATVT